MKKLLGAIISIIFVFVGGSLLNDLFGLWAYGSTFPTSNRTDQTIEDNRSPEQFTPEQPKEYLPTFVPSSPTPKPSNNPDGTWVQDTPDAGNAIKNIPEEYRQLAFFIPELSDRYIEYKNSNIDMAFEKVILYVNIGLDKPFYSDINQVKEPHDLGVLVNKYNKLPDDFKPELEELPSSLCSPGVGRQYLRKDAKDAFERMHDDAKELGLKITAYGTYRSIQTQNEIWSRKVNSGRSIEDVDSLNSRGGHSEHHTGLAVDVIKNNYSVEATDEFEWYSKNAHLYGFIIRYPKGKEFITGYSYEPWHLRYLGEKLATAVYESGLTYEEYCAVSAPK